MFSGFGYVKLSEISITWGRKMRHSHSHARVATLSIFLVMASMAAGPQAHAVSNYPSSVKLTGPNYGNMEVAYLAGRYVQAAVAQTGLLESDFTTAQVAVDTHGYFPVAGTNDEGSILSALGLISIRGRDDDWDSISKTVHGDFFGLNRTGWALSAEGQNFFQRGFTSSRQNGSLSSPTCDADSCTTTWTADSTVSNVNLQITYDVPLYGQFVDVDVQLENRTGSAMDDVYFAYSGYFAGSAEIIDQPDASGFAVLTNDFSDGSEVSFFSTTDEARVFVSGGSSLDAQAAWLGQSGFSVSTGSQESGIGRKGIAVGYDSLPVGRTSLDFRIVTAPDELRQERERWQYMFAAPSLTPAAGGLTIDWTIPFRADPISDIQVRAISVDGGTQKTVSEVSSFPLTMTGLTDGKTYQVRVDGVESGRDGFVIDHGSSAITPQNSSLIVGSKTVSFNPNNGSGSMDDQFAYGATALRTNSFTRDGWTFAGWNTAADGSGNSFSDEASFSFSADDELFAQWAQAPDAPTNLSGSISSLGGDVDLSWTLGANNNAEITSHVVEAKKNGSSDWTVVDDGDGTATNSAATVSGLDPCTLYDFRVSAVNVAGTGPSSTVGTGLSFGSTGLTSIDATRLVLGGDATVASGAVTLTPDLGNRKGAAWSPFRVDLSQSFCLEAEVKLSDAADTSGADGVAFVLQPTDTSTLSSGGGLGYLTDINPSVAVEFDTYPNGSSAGDSSSGQDITLVTLTDSGIADYTGFDRANYDITDDGYSLEDGNFHSTRVAYDATGKTLTVLVDLNADGDFADTGERSVDDVSADLAQFFNDQASTDKVYWGWTAATGGATNLQQVQNVRALPASLPGNTAPSATSPGAQSVAVGASKNVTVMIGDNGETTAAQWRLSASSGDSRFATASASVTSSTEATVAVTGVADGDTTITLTAVDADGASVSASFSLRVGVGSPRAASDNDDDDDPAPVVSASAVGGTSVVIPRRVLTPPQTTLPVTRQGPVLRNGVAPRNVRAPELRLGGQPTSVQAEVPNPSRLSLRAGTLSLGVQVQQDEGGVSQADDGTTEVAVRKGARTTLTGSGLRPESTVQVFLPLQGSNAKELTRIPVLADGSFSGDAAFVTAPDEEPLPIGRQVLQLVSLDADGNEVVVDMTVNIAQPAPAPELNRIEGAIPTLAPGTSIATNAGVPEQITVTAVEDQRLAVIEGDGWNMAVGVTSEDGSVEGTEGGAAIKLVRDQAARVSGEGFMPGTRADVWLFSEPTLLGTVTIDDEGRFDGEVNIDGRVIAVGEHTLQLQGVGTDGYVRSANMGVVVDEPSAGAAEAALESSLSMLWWILGVIVVLALALALVIWVLVRRRASGSA